MLSLHFSTSSPWPGASRVGTTLKEQPMTPQLQSHIAGRWIGTQPAQALKSAID